MRDVQTIEAIRMRLLALVLALALTWYLMNPAPGSVRRVRRGEARPDEKRREARPPSALLNELKATDAVVDESARDCPSYTDAGVEHLDWPDVIDVR
jgi:hypothetical protein